MALAEYFSRAAVAAAQILHGFDEDMLRQRLEEHVIGIAVGPRAETKEGHALADITVRLLARLYPNLVITAPGMWGRELIETARRVNPAITVEDRPPDLAVIIADGSMKPSRLAVYAGSDRWDALVSTSSPVSVGGSSLPFGAGAAGCIAAANVFRAVFLDDPQLDDHVRFSTALAVLDTSHLQSGCDVDLGRVVLAGAGAIGNAVVWALSRAPVRGELDVVDHQAIELSNLQRYLLAEHADKNSAKASHLASRLSDQLQGLAHQQTWQEFVASSDQRIERVLVALDTSRDRRAVQASLPRWIANGWTQPGDLGVSVHPSFLDGACLSCLYFPAKPGLNEDELIAQALRLDHKVWGLRIRNLLYDSQPVPTDLLNAAAQTLGVSPDAAQAFAHRTLRDLYVEGVCGGALVPLNQLGAPAGDLHVPVAHQSALSGILLAACLMADAMGSSPAMTQVTRIDLMRPLGTDLTQPAAKDTQGMCICSDAVYVDAYKRKYGHLRVVSAMESDQFPTSSKGA